jgi:hypothetical protein
MGETKRNEKMNVPSDDILVGEAVSSRRKEMVQVFGDEQVEQWEHVLRPPVNPILLDDFNNANYLQIIGAVTLWLHNKKDTPKPRPLLTPLLDMVAKEVGIEHKYRSSSTNEVKHENE